MISVNTTCFQRSNQVFAMAIPQDVLLHVSDSFLSAIDNGHYVGAVFLEAFNCVDHFILLPHYGVSGNTLSWLTSQRTQQVQGSFSSIGCVKVGVPQGFILRPLLFSIFVNDLPNATSLSCMLMTLMFHLHICEDCLLMLLMLLAALDKIPIVYIFQNKNQLWQEISFCFYLLSFLQDTSSYSLLKDVN